MVMGGDLLLIKIALKQHIGAASAAVVSVSDLVEKGQLIGDCQNGAFGARVHSSVRGRVFAVCDEFVTVLADEKQPVEFLKIEKTASHLEAVRLAGVVGSLAGEDTIFLLCRDKSASEAVQAEIQNMLHA